jgi:death-on-curing protein
VHINQRVIARWGGVGHAVLHADQLLHVLDAIRGAVFGVDQYPTMEDKACAVAYTVARRHVFVDGNKRTGAECLFVMLELNGLTVCASDDELQVNFEGIADGSVPFRDFVEWVRVHLS